jgi:NitT/TauT family transport system substrate-binding protein
MKLKLLIVTLGVFILTLLFQGAAIGADKNPIRIAYLQNDLHQLACWVALEKGFYAQEGLEVRVAGIFKAGPELMSGFAAGALDMGYVGVAPVTTAVANKSARVVVLAQVNSEGSCLVGKKDPGVQNLSDLKGKTLAIPGHATVQDFLLRRILGKWNLLPPQTQILVLKPPEMIAALQNGDIDGFIAWEPFPTRAVTLEVGRTLICSREIWKDHPCCVLVAEVRFLETRPEEAKKMIRAHVKATDFINTNPGEAIQVAVRYTGLDEKTIAQAMKNVTYSYHFNVEAEREYVQYLTQWKYIKVEDVPAFTGQLVNLQFLKDILKK